MEQASYEPIIPDKPNSCKLLDARLRMLPGPGAQAATGDSGIFYAVLPRTWHKARHSYTESQPAEQQYRIAGASSSDFFPPTESFPITAPPGSLMNDDAMQPTLGRPSLRPRDRHPLRGFPGIPLLGLTLMPSVL